MERSQGKKGPTFLSRDWGVDMTCWVTRGAFFGKCAKGKTHRIRTPQSTAWNRHLTLAKYTDGVSLIGVHVS